MSSVRSAGQTDPKQTDPIEEVEAVRKKLKEGKKNIPDAKFPTATESISKGPTTHQQTLSSKDINHRENINQELQNHFDGLRHELKLITDLLPTFFKHGGDITDWMESLKNETVTVVGLVDNDPCGTVEEIKSKLLEIGKMLAKLKLDIQSRQSSLPVEQVSTKAGNGGGEIEKSLVNKFSVFGSLEKDYKDLNLQCKLCLLCLAFFPENVVIKKRLLVYWWVGEGLLDFTEKNTAEEAAEDVIKVLVEKGFVQIVDKMSGLEIDSYRVHPLVRAALIARARETKFFDFDEYGNPTSELRSKCCKSCLVDDGRIPQDRKPDFLQTYLMEGEEEPTEEQELLLGEKLLRLQALFNVNRRFLDFQSRWFAGMKNLNVLHLGRWQNASKHHIEVENPDFLFLLKYMRYLKFVSLQGISQIRVLPDSICRLLFLRVLDLRACHNLQELPEDIGLLKVLTHLDISECYLLDGLPRGVKYLKELQVLKGFVIGDNKDGKFCDLEDLEGFKKLRKLTIHTSNDNFPGKKELGAFQNFVELQKLSIAWGRGTLSNKEEKEGQQQGEPNSEVPQPDEAADTPARPCANQEGPRRGNTKKRAGGKSSSSSPAMPPPTVVEFPKKLVKLDLQCFPHAESPSWLIPKILGNLNKLYIRGGEMKTLRKSDKQWDKVEILLLKFLSGFMLEWDQLRETFPKLIYLEKVNCPRLTFYPCDERGMWKKDATMEKELLEEVKSKRKFKV